MLPGCLSDSLQMCDGKICAPMQKAEQSVALLAYCLRFAAEAWGARMAQGILQ